MPEMLRDLSPIYRTARGMAEAMASYDAALGRLTCPCETFYVPTRFGQTHILAAGPRSAPALVLAHGWNGNATGWWPQINTLSASLRIYAPDTVGQAGRSAPTRPPTRGPAYGEWLADVLDALQLERAWLVGGSGGAWLILKLAEVAGDRIEGAVLLSPAGFVPPRIGFLLRAAWVRMLRPDKDTPMRYARLASPSPLHVDEDEVRLGAPALLHLRPQMAPPTLPDSVLGCLRAPTMVLVGQHEAIFPPQAVISRARRMLPSLVHAEIVPMAGHNLSYERPDLVNEKILGFLAGG
jgi:pimeloyl-ACP methyl ester carboxylesterase